MKTYWMILCILFHVLFIHAQKEGLELIDSLKNEISVGLDDTNKVKSLASLSRELKNYNTSEGISYGMDGLDLARKLNFPFGEGICQLSIAYNYFHSSRIPEAIQFAHEAEKVFTRLNDPDRLCATYLLLCSGYAGISKKKQYDYYMLAKSLFYKGHNLYWKLYNLGWFHGNSRKNEPDSTFRYISLFGMYQKLFPSKYYTAGYYKMLAEYYERTGQLDSALFFYHKSIPFYKELKSNRLIGFIYVSMGNPKCWLASEKGCKGIISVEEAELYTNEAIRTGKEAGILEIVTSAYRNLYRLQKSQGRAKEALHSLEQLILFEDSLQTRNNVQEMTNFTWRIEMELKENEMKLLELRNRQQLIRIITGSIVVAILAILVVVIIRNRSRIQKAYKLVHEQKGQLADLLTQLQETNHRLEVTNQELEAFSYSVSHDLRGPVRRIESLCTALEEDAKDKLEDSDLELVRHISDSTVLMNGLIEDMLKLSRVTRQSVEKSSCNLSELAKKIRDHLQIQYPNQQVQFDLEEDLITQADPNLMQIALQNLLDNAWKYSSKGSNPRVAMGKVVIDGKETFFIRDNGVGFDMGQAVKLFTPFQRLHSDEEFKGTGIGLATVKRIIVKHGGTIWAESEPGKGTTFYFQDFS